MEGAGEAFVWKGMRRDRYDEEWECECWSRFS